MLPKRELMIVYYLQMLIPGNWTTYGAASSGKLRGATRYCLPLKREAKLLTVIGLNTKHADCRIIFMLYPIRL